MFVRNSRSLHGRSNQCKVCDSKYKVARRAAVQAKVDSVKRMPCTDCGGKFPSVAMDFDHVKGEKRWSIAAGIRLGRQWEEIAAELEKCVLVCANCHRVRTWASERHYPNTGAKGS